MAKFQFAGSLQGRATTSVERYGTKDTGMMAEIGGWKGMVRVRVYHNTDKGVDMFRVVLAPHWSDGGKETLLAEGILDHRIDDPFIIPALFA